MKLIELHLIPTKDKIWYKIPFLSNNIDGGIMKKIVLYLLIILGTLSLTGCNTLMNTPTKKVEKLLSMYQTKDAEVLSQLDDALLSETILDNDLKDRYRELMKKQYGNLSYQIKNETIDGDTAVVEVQIEVYDYNSAIENLEDNLINDNSNYIDDNGNLLTSVYNEEKIRLMEEVKNRVTYTINFTVSKIEDNWIVDDLTETERMKLHGLYAY